MFCISVVVCIIVGFLCWVRSAEWTPVFKQPLARALHLNFVLLSDAEIVFSLKAKFHHRIIKKMRWRARTKCYLDRGSTPHFKKKTGSECSRDFRLMNSIFDAITHYIISLKLVQPRHFHVFVVCKIQQRSLPALAIASYAVSCSFVTRCVFL